MPDRSIVAKLRATSAVTTAVGSANRIRCGGMLDSQDDLPGVLVTRDDKRPVNTAGGTDDLSTIFADVTVEVITERYTTAVTIADACCDAINGYTNASGSPAISMVHVRDVAYRPGPRVRGEDKTYEVMQLDCLVQYSE